METLILEGSLSQEDLDDSISYGISNEMDIFNGPKCDSEHGKPDRPDPLPPIPDSNCVSKP
jgi:hypothetical protein